jgi:hypothetical protein
MGKPRLLAIGYHLFVLPMACVIWTSAFFHGVLLDLNQNQIGGLIHGQSLPIWLLDLM